MKSIKLKLWCSIMGITAVVILCFWLFQVILLEDLYLIKKQNKILSDTKSVAETINSSSDLQSLEYSLNSFAFQNNYCIEVTNLGGMTLGVFGISSENSILRNHFKLRQQVLQNILNSGQEYILQDGYSSVYGNRFYVGSTSQKSQTLGNYLLLIESELAPVHEAVNTTKTQLIYLSIILIVLSTFAAFMLSRTLTKPILKISQAAQQVAAGDLNVHVHIKSKDEIGKLSQDFNLMVREINKSSTLQKELVANVSHDIRTPLTMIKGYAEIIKDLTGDNKQKREEQLDVIIEESNRLNVLVNDILDLSRLQAGQITIQKTKFDLGVKLRDVMKRYRLLEINENFQFSLEAPEHCMVYADEVKIEQVLYNIINNATNHTGEDKKVMIALEENEQWATVKISDTGAGIKQEDMPLIWDRYYKPYKKKDRKGMGTGLGLSIVKAILSAHKYLFGVDSVLGKGSTFWFEVEKPAKPDVPHTKLLKK